MSTGWTPPLGQLNQLQQKLFIFTRTWVSLFLQKVDQRWGLERGAMIWFGNIAIWRPSPSRVCFLKLVESTDCLLFNFCFYLASNCFKLIFLNLIEEIFLAINRVKTVNKSER